MKSQQQPLTSAERKWLVSQAQRTLWTDEAADALVYLREKRGLSDEVIRAFRFGYVPYRARDAVREKLGVDLSGRIIMPVIEPSSNEIAFVSTRDISPDCEKHLSHWHEPVVKSHYLYGINLAKEHIIARNAVIVVEGQFDTAYLHSIGLKHAVGLNGSAFNVRQVAILARYCSNFYLFFDGDKAGRGANFKTMTMYEKSRFKEFGMNFFPLRTPDKKDPDDLSRSEIISLCRASQKEVSKELVRV